MMSDLTPGVSGSPKLTLIVAPIGIHHGLIQLSTRFRGRTDGRSRWRWPLGCDKRDSGEKSVLIARSRVLRNDSPELLLARPAPANLLSKSLQVEENAEAPRGAILDHLARETRYARFPGVFGRRLARWPVRADDAGSTLPRRSLKVQSSPAGTSAAAAWKPILAVGISRESMKPGGEGAQLGFRQSGERGVAARFRNRCRRARREVDEHRKVLSISGNDMARWTLSVRALDADGGEIDERKLGRQGGEARGRRRRARMRPGARPAAIESRQGNRRAEIASSASSDRTVRLTEIRRARLEATRSTPGAPRVTRARPAPSAPLRGRRRESAGIDRNRSGLRRSRSDRFRCSKRLEPEARFGKGTRARASRKLVHFGLRENRRSLLAERASPGFRKLASLEAMAEPQASRIAESASASRNRRRAGDRRRDARARPLARSARFTRSRIARGRSARSRDTDDRCAPRSAGRPVGLPDRIPRGVGSPHGGVSGGKREPSP